MYIYRCGSLLGTHGLVKTPPKTFVSVCLDVSILFVSWFDDNVMHLGTRKKESVERKNVLKEGTKGFFFLIWLETRKDNTIFNTDVS